MTATLSRAEQLRNDLENLHFACRYYIGVLAELEQLGKTHTQEYKTAKANLNTLEKNIRRVEEELDKVEEAWIDEELDKIDTNEFSKLCK